MNKNNSSTANGEESFASGHSRPNRKSKKNHNKKQIGRNGNDGQAQYQAKEDRVQETSSQHGGFYLKKDIQDEGAKKFVEKDSQHPHKPSGSQNSSKKNEHDQVKTSYLISQLGINSNAQHSQSGVHKAHQGTKGASREAQQLVETNPNTNKLERFGNKQAEYVEKSSGYGKNSKQHSNKHEHYDKGAEYGKKTHENKGKYKGKEHQQLFQMDRNHQSQYSEAYPKLTHQQGSYKPHRSQNNKAEFSKYPGSEQNVLHQPVQYHPTNEPERVAQQTNFIPHGDRVLDSGTLLIQANSDNYHGSSQVENVIPDLFNQYNEMPLDQLERHMSQKQAENLSEHPEDQHAAKQSASTRRPSQNKGRYVHLLKQDKDFYWKIRRYWEDLVESTDFDVDKAYNLFQRTNTSMTSDGSDFLFKGCMFLVFIEDDIKFLADTLLYHSQYIKKLGAVEAASRELSRNKKDMYEDSGDKKKVRMRFMNLGSFRVPESAVSFINKFDYFSKGWSMQAFDKIKSQTMIAMAAQINPYQNEYISVLQIAIEDHIFVFDLIALCYDENKLTALVEFFTSLMNSPSNYIITVNARSLMKTLVKSLFIDKESDKRALVGKKKDLCRLLEQNEHKILDVMHYEPEMTFKSIVEKHLNGNYTREYEFSDWTKRPLSKDQIYYSAFKAFAVLQSFKSIVSKVELRGS